MRIDSAHDRRPAKPLGVMLPVFVAAIVCLPSTGLALHDRYHTYDEVHTELLAAAANYPSLAKLDTVGVSTEDGMDIWSLKISDNVDLNEDEPTVFYNGIHHAEEVLGLEVSMWMIDELLTGYGVNDTITSWVDDTEIWFIPLLNPEGHKVVTDSLDEGWRKNKRDNNENGVFDLDYDGVDPNNNYDFNWAEGGSGDPTSPYYRGTAPFSENESQIVRDLCLAEKPIFALNFHSPAISAGDCVYYPWYWPAYGFSPDFDVISDIAGTLASLTKTEGGSSFSSIYGYATSGKARNWQYGVLGTIGLTMEIWNYGCQPPGEDVDGFCERVSTGSYYLLDRIWGPGITGHVVDATTGDPIVAEVKVVENSSDQIEPRLTDATYGAYWRMLLPGSYTVEFSCDGYATHTRNNVTVGPSGLALVDCSLWPEGVEVPDEKALSARIEGISPNPFRGSATVSFTAPAALGAVVEIYSVSGALVARLKPADSGCGGSVTWDGTGREGQPVPSGVYFARLVCGAERDQETLVLLR